MPTPSPTTQTPSQRVVVESIGSARPALAGLLASQLGLPANQVANALYKAPSVLLEALPQEQACGLASILQQAGLAVRVEPSDMPRPAAAVTFDIALYVTEVANDRSQMFRPKPDADSAKLIRPMVGRPME